MPKVRGLTQREREAQAIENEIQRASREFLAIVGERRGREDKTYEQMAEYIGVCPTTFRQWRRGKLPSSSFGDVVSVSRKLGYRIVFEPIAAHGKGANA